jgi:hypothetical protein
MYTLRTVTESNKQINQLIGDLYSVIDRHVNYDEFSDVFFDCFGVKHVADLDETSNEFTKSCHGFLEHKGEYIPLYFKNNYYIMTESGKTFSNLSYKQVEKK